MTLDADGRVRLRSGHDDGLPERVDPKALHLADDRCHGLASIGCDDLELLVTSVGPRGPGFESMLELLAQLKPVFDRSEEGTMTAGNSTPLTDGAAAVPAAGQQLIGLENPDLQELQSVGFELTRGGRVQIDAIGMGDRGRGNLAAYGQTNIKRLLAYSTIAHAGYMLMAVAAQAKWSFDQRFYLGAAVMGVLTVIVFLTSAKPTVSVTVGAGTDTMADVMSSRSAKRAARQRPSPSPRGSTFRSCS